MIYKSNNPYPTVQISQKNPEYAALLLEDYAGVTSEDSAIHLYLYQSFIKQPNDFEYQTILLHISEVEMIHLKLLGEAITQLGTRPIFCTVSSDGIERFWNAGYIPYNLSLKEMLIIDIQAETQAIQRYQKQLTIIQDPNIQKIIQRILEDEKIHLSIFQNLYQKYFINS